MNGVMAPMAMVTLSTSSRPVSSVSTSMRTAPIHTGQPHCWLRLAPAPANMAKPMQNRQVSVAKSRTFDTMGVDTALNTEVCSLER